MTIGYGWEKSYDAASALASPGDWSVRIEPAYLDLMRIRPEGDLPASLRGVLAEIMEPVNRAEPQGDEGKIRAAIASMSEADASRIADKIFHLCSSLAGLYDRFVDSVELTPDDPVW